MDSYRNNEIKENKETKNMEKKNDNKRLERGAGILLPISSLPSPYGIGSLGKEAYHFVDQ